MAITFPRRYETFTVAQQERRNVLIWRLWFLIVLALTALTIPSGLRKGLDYSTVAWCCYFGSAIAILYRPRLGVYLIVGLTLVGDRPLASWYPFIVNFSSYGSLLYGGDSLVFSPLESFLALTLASWLMRLGVVRKRDFYAGPLFWPAMVFISFIAFGAVYGLVIRRGVMNIGLWECRAIFYLPIMLVLVSNLIKAREHVNRLVWIIMIAVFIKSLLGVWYVAFELKFAMSGVERIADHSASIHWNALIVMSASVWLYRGSLVKRAVLPVMLPFVLFAHLSNQRRASMVAVIIALFVILLLLFKERRTAFFLLAPTILLVGSAYVGVFWNASGPLAVPARAVKSIIAPDTNSGRDNASNEYRVIENINSMFTIRSHPLTGVGFGQKFYIVAAMPDISSFAWWEYITHNSVMWIWVKTGVGGFASMVFLVGFALMSGARALWRMPGDEMSAMTLLALLYVLMHFIYAYVDMSWYDQNMVAVGAMMGLLNCIERIVAQPVSIPPKRWPWQTEKVSPPGLLPL